MLCACIIVVSVPTCMFIRVWLPACIHMGKCMCVYMNINVCILQNIIILENERKSKTKLKAHRNHKMELTIFILIIDCFTII